MANPRNFLDRFVSYTYHFELHAAASQSTLDGISKGGVNRATPRNEPVDTLLINTRKDAHQNITSVVWTYLGPGVMSSSMLAPFDELHMTIEEPGSAFFYEKIQKIMLNNQTSNVTSLVFGLKILFVGRTADDVEEVVDELPMLRLMMSGFNANFTFKGGTYSLIFVNSGTAGISPVNGHSNSNYSYTHKAFSIQATRLREALGELEAALNANYREWFDNQTNKPNVRQFEYEINAPNDMDGTFVTTNAVSTAAGSKYVMSFTQQMQIHDMIHKVVQHCPEIMERMKQSRTSFMQPKHPGAFIYTVVPRVIHEDNALMISYAVEKYEGEPKDSQTSSNDYEFNFYFSGAGQNVDVLDFDMKLEQSITMFLAGKAGSDHAANLSGKLPFVNPQHYSSNVVHSDVSLPREQFRENERANITELSPNDVAPAPATPQASYQGYNSHPENTVATFKEAMDVISIFQAATGGAQKTLRIRGHLGLLNACWTGPRPGQNAFGITSGLWVKVNIYDENGRQFFYRDFYWVSSIKNTFSGGQFIQELVLIATPKNASASATGTGAANVDTSLAQNPAPEVKAFSDGLDARDRQLIEQERNLDARDLQARSRKAIIEGREPGSVKVNNTRVTTTGSGAAIILRPIRRTP